MHHLDLRRIGGVGQRGRIEAGALVGDDVDDLGRGLSRGDVDAANAVGELAATAGDHLVVGAAFDLAEVRRDLEVAVVHGVDEGLAEGDANLDQGGFVDGFELGDARLQVTDEVGNDRDVVVEDEARFGVDQPLEDAAHRAAAARELEHGGDGGAEVLREAALGDVAGGALLQGADGDLFAAVRRHQDHGDVRVTKANRLDQLEPVELGHLQIGDDDVGRIDGEEIERLAPVGGERDLVPGFAEDAAGPGAIEARVVDDEHRRHQRRPVQGRCVIALARGAS